MAKIETILRPQAPSIDPRISVVVLAQVSDYHQPIRLEMGSFKLGPLHVKLISKEDIVIFDRIQHIEHSTWELIVKIRDLKSGVYHCIVDDDFFVQIKELKIPA